MLQHFHEALFQLNAGLIHLNQQFQTMLQQSLDIFLGARLSITTDERFGARGTEEKPIILGKIQFDSIDIFGIQDFSVSQCCGRILFQSGKLFLLLRIQWNINLMPHPLPVFTE